MKTKVVVSRKYEGTEIEAFAGDNSIGSRMNLDDFLAALVEEVGNPTTIVTKSALLDKLKFASIAVTFEMKKAVVQVLTDK